MNLSNDVKITKVAVAAVSAGTEVLGSILDMQGYEGVVFVTSIATANAGNLLKVKQDDDSAMGSPADLEGSGVVATANAEVVFADVYQPTKRYVRASVIRAGANTAVGDIYAIQYKPKVMPVVNEVTDTVVGAILVSPDEGVA